MNKYPMMKKQLIIALSVAVMLVTAGLMTACKTMTAAELAELAKKVTKCLDERHYTIDVQMMMPQGGPARNVSGNWSLEVRNDSLFSYLPYVGRAFNIPMGGGKGLNFTAPIIHYTEATGKNGKRRIEIDVRNDEDSYNYMIEVFDNGNASIDVTARERDNISFSGNLVVDD